MRQSRAQVVAWLVVFAGLWVIQLWWLGTAATSWSGYWHWRGVYRPGIQAVQATGGSMLPSHVFHPLSPSGARWAFLLASGVYAVAGTLVIWAIWRITRPRRRRLVRRVARAAA